MASHCNSTVRTDGVVGTATGSCPNCNAASFDGSSLVDSSQVGWSHTRIIVSKFSHTWTIYNFSFCDEKSGEYVASPTFSAGCKNELEWRLHLYPRGLRKEEEGYLSLYLQLASQQTNKIKTKFELSVLNDKGEKISKVLGEWDFVNGTGQGLHKFIKLEFLRDKANGLLPEDNLTIRCEGTAAVDRINISGPSSELQIKVPECKLSQDLGSLLENQKFNDITFSVSGKKLYAYKGILSARSSVFAAMFEHEMKESILNEAVITDIDYEVFREMLIYIYTGTSPNIQEVAASLLVVADRYHLDELKKMCEQVMSPVIDVENAAEFLIIADSCCADLLKTQVLRFISIQAKDMMLRPAWKKMFSTHPHLILEAFNALALQSCATTATSVSK